MLIIWQNNIYCIFFWYPNTINVDIFAVLKELAKLGVISRNVSNQSHGYKNTGKVPCTLCINTIIKGTWKFPCTFRLLQEKVRGNFHVSYDYIQDKVHGNSCVPYDYRQEKVHENFRVPCDYYKKRYMEFSVYLMTTYKKGKWKFYSLYLVTTYSQEKAHGNLSE